MIHSNTGREPPQPSFDLNCEVLAGFTRQGLTLATYCKANGIRRQHARACLIGIWTGPRADRLRYRLCEAAGVE